MIIIGDIASPSAELSKDLLRIFQAYPMIFGKNYLICNLEGLIDDAVRHDKTPVLYNHPSVLKALGAGNCKAVGLANNHTLDLPDRFDGTVEQLEKNGIMHTGAARIKKDADKPVFFQGGSSEIILFNACWDFLLYHHSNPAGGVYVAEIHEKDLIRSVAQCRGSHPKASLVVFLHWGFDLESLPFPMCRQLAKKLIEEGANVVVGSHSHCVQGGEKWKEGFIVYGLGDFFMPSYVFSGGNLVFPDLADIRLAFEWDQRSNEGRCHWFKQRPDEQGQSLVCLGSEKFEESRLLQRYSPYSRMTDKDYLRFFKKNRRKKMLVPVFKDYNNQTVNKWKTGFLKYRARVARFLASRGLRKWQN